MVEWWKGLQKKKKGLYYEGIIDGSRLDSVPKLHKRSRVSTFRTRRSSRVSVAAQTEKLTNKENVYKRTLNNIIIIQYSANNIQSN